MSTSFSTLPTEQSNPATLHIDRADTLEMLHMIHAEDLFAVQAMEPVLPQLATAADAIAARLKTGGRVFYAGAGTSGRIGVLDASELPATYGTDPSLVQALVPGGYGTLADARLGNEDDAAGAAEDVRLHDIGAQDAVVGIAASGKTPYTVAVVTEARRRGAFTVAIVNAPHTPLTKAAALPVVINTGAEVIQGSTRMKAGTTQKLALNMLSTAVMIRLGNVYENKMVEITAINEKMTARCIDMLTELTGADTDTAARMLESCHHHVKTAAAALLLHCDATQAAKQLAAHDGQLSALLR